MISPENSTHQSNDLVQLLESTQDRTEQTRLQVLLWCQNPHLVKILKTTYNYTPEQFADVFTSAYDQLLNVLPNPYRLDFKMEDIGGLSIEVDNWIVREDIREKAQKKASNHSYPSTPYRYQFEAQTRIYNSFISDLKPSGFFGFSLMQIKDEAEDGTTSGIIIENLHSGLTVLKEGSRPPLRWKEGSEVNISDAIRNAEEALIKKIAKDKKHPALLTTTGPSTAGEKMLNRQGYIELDKLILPQPELDFYHKSFAFERGIDRFYRGKVIFIPPSATTRK